IVMNRLVCLAMISVGLLTTPAWGYLGLLQSLGQVIGDSKHIVVLQVDKVNREKKVIIFKKVADLKGTHPTPQIRHHVGGGDARESGPPEVAEDSGSDWIGYTEYRTNLPGGRHPNQAPMRAYIVRGNGKDQRPVAEELTKKPDTWTQFGAWSPDGKLAVIYQCFNSPKNAAAEEKQGSFRIEGRFSDCYFLDLATGKLTNLTAVERVSHNNAGLSFW